MIGKAARKAVHARAEGLCERCCGPGHTYHHRKNRSAGLDDTPVNLVLLCGDGVQLCHGQVTRKPALAAKFGWHVKPWENPAEIPVLWRGSTWVLLDEFGGMSEVHV